MDKDLIKQKNFWSQESENFDAIYSRHKGWFGNWLNQTFRWDMYERFQFTMKHAMPIEGRTFLDVGCGTGRYSLELARKGASKVIGIDISERMIEICRERAQKENLDSCCQFLQTDLLEYQPDEKFDICIGIGLFDYIRNPLPVLTKMRELSRVGVIMSFPRFWTWRAPVRKLRLFFKGCDVFFYTHQKVNGLLQKAGFADITNDKIGQLYCTIASPTTQENQKQ
ncbi:MAG: methyltransferase domain-containing protein [Acidobacteria bacterium]|nr:methyltransferase domain-containing protein [Acidobacteriota bacterium]